MDDIYATCCAHIDADNSYKALIIQGQSGAGKSLLATSLIHYNNFVLISDDRCYINIQNGAIQAHYNAEFAGQIELYHLGICHVSYAKQATIIGAITLSSTQPERMQNDDRWTYNNASVPHITLPANSSISMMQAYYFWHNIVNNSL